MAQSFYLNIICYSNFLIFEADKFQFNLNGLHHDITKLSNEILEIFDNKLYFIDTDGDLAMLTLNPSNILI